MIKIHSITIKNEIFYMISQNEFNEKMQNAYNHGLVKAYENIKSDLDNLGID